jgi:hypothetical protein
VKKSLDCKPKKVSSPADSFKVSSGIVYISKLNKHSPIPLLPRLNLLLMPTVSFFFPFLFRFISRVADCNRTYAEVKKEEFEEQQQQQ